MLIGIEASRANRAQKTGTERYAHDLLCALAVVDRSTDFLLYTDRRLMGDLSRLGENFHERLLSWPPRRLWTQVRLSMEMLARSPDALFVPAHTLPLFHPSVTVTTLHDVGFERSPELYARRELLYHRWAVRFALRHAKRIIVPSSFTRDEILALYPNARKERLFVIHHGFSSKHYQRPSDETIADVRRRFGLSRPYVLYVGRIQEKKNIPNLLEAFALLRDRREDLCSVQLLLAGQKDFGISRIIEIVRKRKLKDSVIMPGYTPPDDLRALLHGASVFAFPSRYEGFGFPILEAQACAVPVLASTAASLAEVGGRGALYCDPDDQEGMARGLERLLTDTTLTTGLREEGKKNLTRFDWRLCAAQTLKTITDAVKT